jgi:pyruvate/2-oxoglutarate/acetoin dehydrogenase E1 component
MRKITYAMAINEAIREEMERDKTVFLMGEDVGPMGGAFAVTRGLFDKFGRDRIKDTPISEFAILGSAMGAALTGMRPVAEIMRCDFIGVCLDEILNQMSKRRYSSGGQLKVPLVVRFACGAGMFSGPDHSQSTEAFLIHTPGVKVVYPSTPYDAKGLLKAAIRDDNPVMFFEHRGLYHALTDEVPEEEYIIPLGKGDIKREGSDVTIVATARMVHKALAAAAELQEQDISVEVVDPRTLLPIDKQLIIESVKKTSRLIICTEECKTGSVAAEIAAIVAEEAFDYLDAPIKRVNAPDIPLPFSPPLQEFYVPNEKALIDAVAELGL